MTSPRPAARAALLALALAAFPFVAFAQAPGPAPVTVARPVVRELVEWTQFAGRFEAVEQVDVRARVGGYLEAVHFTDGTVVNAGDLLFTIDPRPFQAVLDQAEAAVAQAEAQVEFARSELERAQRLQRSGAGTERTLDERRQQSLAAQAALRSAQAAVRQARLNLEFTEVRAPVAGRISRRLVTPGNLVEANATRLTTIVSLAPIHFYFDIDERTYLALSRLAQTSGLPSAANGAVQVRLALSDEDAPSRTGSMDFVDNRVDRDSGTVRVRAVFDNADGLLSPGLFGRIDIPATPLYRAVLVPDEAIGADLARRFVYVIGPDGAPRQQEVRPGPREFGYRVVRGGLTGDETVVVNGLQRIRPGAQIAPQMVELPPER
jgi:RND family efflux transporter MFP subunit